MKINNLLLGVAAVATLSAGLWAASTPEPKSTSSTEAALEPEGGRFDPQALRRVTVDELLVSFADSEVAGNDQWSGASIALVGYSVGTQDNRVPIVEIKAQGDRSMVAEMHERDAAASIRSGETVELLCLGASAQYGKVTAHDCELNYHGKRREQDPYWATPAAIQDPL